MRLADYIERTKMVDIEVFPAEALPGLLDALEKQPSVADIETDWADVLGAVPVAHLRRLSEACRNWREREETLQQVLSELEKAGQPTPPQEALDRALVPHKVTALGRAVHLCSTTQEETQEEWALALQACVDAWSGAVNLALKRGELSCRLDMNHPDKDRFSEYARRREPLSGLAGHRWLAIRRGEREGALSLTFKWPLSNITALIESFRPRMGKQAQTIPPEKLVQTFVIDHLEQAVRGVLDRKVEDEAIRAAVSLYSEILSSPPLCLPPVGAVSVGRPGSPLGVAILGKGLSIQSGQEVSTSSDWKSEVQSALAGHGIECVVVPRSAPDQATLAELRQVLSSDYAVHPVRNAALAEARSLVLHEHPELRPAVASAVVLAARAVDPSGQWSKVNPVGLGLAEYQNDLDLDRLRIAMKDALSLHRLEHRRSGPITAGRNTAGPAPTPRPPVLQPSSKRIKANPLVNSLSDLKPGMTVQGVVSNITRFGVFVDLGLEEEAMIHVSELSNEFVSSPTDVVSLGQDVTARVLGVDLQRKRVALTMKEPQPRRRSSSDRSRPAPKNKAEALAQLENLFKK